MKQYIINRDMLKESESFATATADELRVLIAVVANDGEITDASIIAQEAKTSACRAKSSLVLWEESGILTLTERQSITEEFEENINDSAITAKIAAKTIRSGELAEFMENFAEMTGVAALSTEAAKLISAVYGELGVSTDYMLSLAVYISEKGKLTAKRFFIEAEKLVKRGVDTDEALAEYINEKKNEAPAEWEFRRLIGIYDRTLTKSEKTYVKRWYTEYGYGNELIGEAYDIMISNKGKLALPYMNKILTDWKDGGVFDVKNIPAPNLSVSSGNLSGARSAFSNASVDAVNAKSDRERYYALLREKAQTRADKYLAMANGNARFKEIDTELSKMEIALAKAEVFEPKNLPALKQKKQSLLSERKSILFALKIDESDLLPKFSCDQCSDTGFLKNGVACGCYKG